MILMNLLDLTMEEVCSQLLEQELVTDDAAELSFVSLVSSGLEIEDAQ
jgi:hypothetical protein